MFLRFDEPGERIGKARNGGASPNAAIGAGIDDVVLMR